MAETTIPLLPSHLITTAQPTVKMEEPDEKQEKKKGFWHNLKKGFLPIMTVVCTALGVGVGLILRANSEGKPWRARHIMYMQFPGEIFLRMLKMLIIPLMVSSITAAVGGLDLSLSKKIGIRSILYYSASTGSAVLEGVILVTLIHPGNPEIYAAPKNLGASLNSTTTDTLLDLIRNMFPPNLVQSCVAQYRTILTPPVINGTMDTSVPMDKWNISGTYDEGSNVLGLVVFSVVQGIALGKMGKMGKPLLDFYGALEELTMVITRWVLWLSPAGVFFLVVSKILEAESFAAMVGQLGMYFLTVLLGLIIHGLFVLPMFYFICCKKLPLKFIANMGQAAITAFATGSSSASLSVSMQCLEEKNKVDVRISRFVMPIGATINMDGTALYEAVAVIFISQIRQMTLSVGQLFAVSIAATMASIGAASIPSAGLITMVMVLETVGLKADDVTLIYAVDWLLDRFRTMVNVIGDAYGAGIVEHLSRKELDELPPLETNKRD
ncbi:excitatory amino acid transporter 3 [Halyomorpha halys]|uniref:excitatory amino acid transporter 3 n=1 Tax=Halyomorpha halys TaxID=286706 RepID=UPI0006D5234B|nr:excitatory amino acid transporter 3-like [Halyomorpha halys]